MGLATWLATVKFSTVETKTQWVLLVFVLLPKSPTKLFCSDMEVNLTQTDCVKHIEGLGSLHILLHHYEVCLLLLTPFLPDNFLYQMVQRI